MAIKVLVVDDSAFMRKLITEIINVTEGMEVVGFARNGQDALQKLAQLDVDVVTLDVEMPILDGLQTLQQIMGTKPLPVVMLSSKTKKGSQTTVQALALGAVDFVAKPSGPISPDLEQVSEEIVQKIRLAAGAKFTKEEKKTSIVPHRKSAPTFPKPSVGVASRLVIIGSSTGGPKAIEEVFTSIPPNLPAGIVVVQHMPRDFTRSFAERLDSLFPFPVKEASHGDFVENGKVLIAPGDYHLVINKDKTISLNQEEKVMFLRPAVDVTMAGLSKVYGNQIIGVILTGMGRDGSQGMAEIKKAGGITIAQDRNTSTIYSMPRFVAEEGNADYILPLDRIGGAITDLVATMR